MKPRLLGAVGESRVGRELLWPSSAWSRYGPPVLWMILLFVLSSIPGDRYPEVRIIQFDKVVHFLMYVPLGIGMARAMAIPGAQYGGLTGRRFWICVALGALYGASDEIHQLFVPNRSANVPDWLIDVLAVWTGTAVWQRLLRMLPQMNAY